MKALKGFLFLALLVLPVPSFASGSGDSCATKYPVVLAHGMGASAEILGIVDYWWGIEEAIEGEGGTFILRQSTVWMEQLPRPHPSGNSFFKFWL